MKNYLMGVALATMIYSATACTNNVKTEADQKEATVVETQSTNPKFADEKMNDVYQHYIHLKTALLNNDTPEAEMGTKMLDKAIKDAGISSKYIAGMVEATTVKAKREKLSSLSNELAETFRSAKITSGVVYKQYCPMANAGKGGFWLASESKIQNPYYGKQMMSCGSVEEEIK